MIVTEMKPFGVIKALLKPEDKISIVSCNTCARMCETGGEEAVKKMQERLKQEGFNVVDTSIATTACDIDQIRKLKVSGDTVLVLACDAAVYGVKKIFPDKNTIVALDTEGLAAWDEKKNITIVKKFEK